MNALDRCLARDAEWTARGNVIRLRPAPLPPHPPAPAWEPLLRECVVTLKDAFGFLIMWAVILMCLAFYVGVGEGRAEVVPVVEIVPADQFAMYAFKGTYGE